MGWVPEYLVMLLLKSFLFTFRKEKENYVFIHKTRTNEFYSLFLQQKSEFAGNNSLCLKKVKTNPQNAAVGKLWEPRGGGGSVR